MPRHHQLASGIAPDGVGSERIVSRHVRMHDLNLALLNQARQFASTESVERISQSEGGDARGGEVQLRDKRRGWS